MEILNKNAALLSNSEVYSLLKQTKLDLTHKLIKKKNLDPNNANLNQQVDKHLPTVVYESLRYLEKSNCARQTPEIVAEFLKKLQPYKLTKIEKLLILNHCPKSAVELQVLIEDSEERFSVEQMDELVEFVKKNLPLAQDETEDDENDPDEAMQTNRNELD